MAKEDLERIAIAQFERYYSVFKYYKKENRWYETGFSDINRLTGYLTGLIEGSGKYNVPIDNGLPLGYVPSSWAATNHFDKKTFKKILSEVRRVARG